MRGILQAVLTMTEENLLNKQEFLVHGQHFFYSHDCLTGSAVIFYVEITRCPL